ncbi:D-serine ammonia-lyase [Neobacillus sp. MM2021_6]|uniref:D-serine ammonia-lyase n=1 Tax=Bacillaceae TaxID=186817 RepID=UPI001408A540|nr:MULTISPECIES: D-serine ammonia-lyase [Bacillaceae]MBO0962098.1 D-serine ammonia-lyase [Neobacillus sp. MM2021_6]NHC20066.1 D-serine ammonia-lyase [Bacillus sp. MM2020_4]
MVLSSHELKYWKREFPLLKKITKLQPVLWLNTNLKPMKDLPEFPVTIDDMIEAEQLWERFIPFFIKEFPETKELNGIIESPLKKINRMKTALPGTFNGDLYLKCDNELPIAGSIKSRGGVYEVLHHAEQLAIKCGLVSKNDNYEVFSEKKVKNFFSQYKIGVGSTGNLGLSIGIISAKLGFNVSVYMSADAKQWKKDLLREKGATVYEFSGDFGEAIRAGRQETLTDPQAYFVDDEKSKHLFLGYSVAAFRLQKQLKEKNIKVDKDHPLLVYLPCGVGGSPGGITFGLKQIFGDHVHCFFVEPTHSPSVLIGLLTGEKEKVCVQDFGIDNRTEADGLAVGRPSSFATSISEHLISGIYTVEDDELYRLLALLADNEGIFIEPSSTSGLMGPELVANSGYLTNEEKGTHIVWATGGSLVPQADMEHFYQKGKELIHQVCLVH